MMAQEKVPVKLVKKTINSCIKQELSAQGINTTTRQGNKELKFLIDKVARYTFKNEDEVKVAGDTLGKYLSRLFQEKKKENLDRSIIRQVANQRDLWSLAGLSMPESKSAEILVEQEYTSKATVNQTSEDKEQMTKATEISEKETAVSEAETPENPDDTEVVEVSEVEIESSSEPEVEAPDSQDNAETVVSEVEAPENPDDTEVVEVSEVETETISKSEIEDNETVVASD